MVRRDLQQRRVAQRFPAITDTEAVKDSNPVAPTIKALTSGTLVSLLSSEEWAESKAPGWLPSGTWREPESPSALSID
jgi:hypothetical protein